ncbi:MAG: hypothetical protein N3C12_15160 [Candidatus Binatia bacterium]|nr:hypothetical protein [Candidatus Binatia bacterium]
MKGIRLLLAVLPWLQPASLLAHEVFVIGTTQPRSGELRIWRFAEREVQVYRVLCQSGTCFFTASDPGFTGDPAHGGSTDEELAADGLSPLPDDTDVWLEIIAIAPQVKMGFGSVVLAAGGQERVLLGQGRALHNHPSWRLVVPEGASGSFPVTFRLTTTKAGFSPSPAYTVYVTAAEASTSPTATPTPVPPACVGDCDNNGEVTVEEIVRAVNIGLGSGLVADCTAVDHDEDGTVTVDEIVAAVNAALFGCTPGPQ